MFDLVFAGNVAAAVKGADAILLLAPERQLRAGWLEAVTDAPWVRLLARAAKEATAGPEGKTVSAQNPYAGPDKVVLGVLPDAVSRHNAPARTEAISAAVKAAGFEKSRAAVIACLEDRADGLAVARAVSRALPSFSRATKSSADGPSKIRVAFAAADADGKTAAISKPDKAIVQRARWAAMLVDTPTQDMTTADFVRVTRSAARGLAHVRISVIAGADVLKKKLGGLHAVGRTAVQGPRLLLIDYKPPKSRRTIGLVGKGIVYDTGGLSIKSSAGMPNMKCDMGGAAGMVGAILALAEAGHRDRVICAAALAENAVGPNSYRPDDILTMHSGKTVEINNTDAEGRLVLADAASYLARTYDVDAVFDMATLTGAQLVATGHAHAAVVSNRAGLEAAAVEAGRISGDLTFPLPFAPELYQREFRSKVADMKNSVADRMNAQSSCAAQFVYSHIQDLDIPWLHVDIAGPAFRDERGTGFGVALVAVLLRRLTNAALKL